ncbi:yceI_2 [Blepharisma stoltei]|uniref:Major facilitator superfamily (MFS) profile domain-containing protein n=1 Tax=Blepharisma stoltei TaxID=1481888 RepID=A0AAU9J5C8_9CILI|nr:unnamed protein product [Blepharisma stoltei]
MTEDPVQVTIEAIDKIGWGPYQNRLFYFVFASYASIQFYQMSIGYFGEEFGHAWDISNTQKGLMGTLFQLGSLLGAYIWGSVSDNFGRIFSLKINALLLVFSSFIWLFSSNFPMLLVLCFISGVGNIAEIVILPVVFEEFCPEQNLNYMTKLTSGWYAGGSFFAICAIIIYWINSNYLANWLFMAGLIFFYQILVAIPRLDLDECPEYHCTKLQFHKANETLHKIAKENKFSSEYETIEEVINPVQKKKETRLHVIFNREHIKSTLLMSTIFFMILFGYWSFILFMPKFLSQYNFVVKYIIICVQQGVGIPCAYLSAYMIDTKLGRKHTLSISLLITAFASFLFIFSKNFVSIIIVSSIWAGISSTAYGALFTMAPESFPSEVRSTAEGLFLSSSRAAGVIAPLIAGPLLDTEGGEELAFAIFAVAFLIGAVCALFLKETRPIITKEGLIIKN